MSGTTLLKPLNSSKRDWRSPIRKMACCLSFLLWLALLQTSLAVNVPGPNGTVVTQILSATSSNSEVKVVEDRDLGKILVYPPQPKEFTVKIIARIMYPDDQYLEKISTVMVGGAGVTIESDEIRNSLILATLKVAPGASGGRFSITYENEDNPNHKGCNVRLLPVEVEVSNSKLPESGTFGKNPVKFNGGDLGDPEAFPPEGPKGKSLQLFRKYFTDDSGSVLVPIKVDFKFEDENFPELSDLGMRWEDWGNPDSGDFHFGSTKSAYYLFERPSSGEIEPGLYQFQLVKGFDEEVMRVNVLLPAAGGTIDDWMIAEVSANMTRATTWQSAADTAALSNGETDLDDFRDTAFKAIMHCYFDYQGVAKVAGKNFPTDRYSYTDSNQTDPAKKGNGDWDEPSYATIRGHVISRAKITNLFYAVWGRKLGRSKLELRAGAFFNAALRGQWDNQSSQNAIVLGSDLYDAANGGGNVGATLTSSRVRGMQTPDVLNDLNLWPVSQVATSNFTLPAMPTNYSALDEGTDECDGGSTRGK